MFDQCSRVVKEGVVLMVERIKLGMKLLDALMPDGFPRNVFVVIKGEPGTGKTTMMTELAFRTLERGEPVVMVVFGQTPLSLIQRFLSMEWDITEHIERKKIVFIDGFSTRVAHEWIVEKMHGRVKEIYKKFREVMRVLKTPGDPSELYSVIYSSVENMGMIGQGAVIIDSLTELMVTMSQTSLLDFIRRIRSTIVKELWVPVFASVMPGLSREFDLLLDCIVDGVIDVRFNPVVLQKGGLIREARIRKMPAKVLPIWVPFTVDKGIGALPVRETLERLKEGIERALKESLLA